MLAKTCQLDIIPTDRLKQVLDVCLPALTHITNESLETNQFCKEWKEDYQIPDKKTSAGLVKTNYKTVSNLGFISKIVEKVTLIQFTEHCDENKILFTY